MITTNSVLAILVPLILAGLSIGCGPNVTRVAEKPIPGNPSTALAAGLPADTSAVVGPPTSQDIDNAVDRVFGGDVLVPDPQHPAFLTADFNGDNSQDVIVTVKPRADKLDDINNDVANWTIQNPRKAYLPPKNKKVVTLPPTPKPERIQAGETLFAVIHGYGPAGWRDSMARQAYLLRQAVGTSASVSQPSPGLIRDFGIFPSPRSVIAEDLGGKRGVIYWTGDTYAWHLEK